MRTLRRLLCESVWSTDFSDFRQTVGMDPGSNLLTFPSMWNNLLKQSSLKCSEQTMNRPLGLKFFRCKQTKAFHFAQRPLLAGDQCREIPAAGFDELLQPWTTQRLITSPEHTENNSWSIVFRRSKYTYFSQRRLPLCILNQPRFQSFVVTMTSVPFSTQSSYQTRTFLIRAMADGLSTKLQPYLSDFSLEF